MSNDYAVNDFAAINKRLKEIEAKRGIGTSDIPEAIELRFEDAIVRQAPPAPQAPQAPQAPPAPQAPQAPQAPPAAIGRRKRAE